MTISREPSRDKYHQLGLEIKRGIDLVVGIILLVVLSPFFLIIAIWIRLDSSGPVIYKHSRIGWNGRPFYLYKFRSMTAGGDDAGYMDYLKQLIQSEEQGEGIPYRKMSGDSRITRAGSFLRKFYLDEIPQLWNIIKGEMSLVGPRPHIQFEVDHYTPQQRQRLVVRPGATGLWQVEGKADCTFSELIDLDLQYIENWNLALDGEIMLKTLLLMVKGGEGFWARMAKHVPGQRRVRTRRYTNMQPSSTKIDSRPIGD
jgi:lipopolysaccharide/colanic/teichoic acid biosynthesis glycosyltransferase